jgi:hypothetical protein
MTREGGLPCEKFVVRQPKLNISEYKENKVKKTYANTNANANANANVNRTGVYIIRVTIVNVVCDSPVLDKCKSFGPKVLSRLR